MLYSFNAYKEIVMDILKREVGADYVKEIVMAKTNGVKKIGVRFLVGNNKFSPVLYFNTEKGIYNENDIDEFVRWGLETCKDTEKCTEKELDGLMDWNVAKEHVQIRLLNGPKNEEQLKGFYPYIKVMDLVATFDLDSEGILPKYGNGRARITKHMMEAWGVNEYTLYKTGIQNMERDGYEFEDIRKFLGILLDAENTECDKRTPSLYVLRTYDGIYGACAMLNKKIMGKVCDSLGCDTVFILPSSVHELIVISAEDMEVKELKDMVCEINECIVGEEEFLADNVYQYSRFSCELKIAEMKKDVMAA